ncbi:hypothetical protein KACC15558_11370 [Brevibacterium ammoniilyticum]|uniref:Uncharacterized protein n=1 Tax=Brevibacterium ammoniilyticum TaxID=1046555 RepID=A0ABP9TXR9_9MICO
MDPESDVDSDAGAVVGVDAVLLTGRRSRAVSADANAGDVPIAARAVSDGCERVMMRTSVPARTRSAAICEPICPKPRTSADFMADVPSVDERIRTESTAL